MDPSTAVLDAFDIDLLVKVLANTAFSPFFTVLVPAFFFAQGESYTGPAVIGATVYFLLVSLFWLVKWCSLLYRNKASFFFSQPPLDWSHQVVVITGGSSGIGELLANTLAVRNVTVAVLDVKPIQTENYNIQYYKCDVSNRLEVEQVAKKVIDELGQPTVLVNNAAVVQGKLLLDLSPEDVEQTFGVNTLAHFWTLKAFLPGMIKKKSGHIVTVSSISGKIGIAQLSDYCASKAALISLHETLRYELDKRYECPNIRTTLVLPGHVKTPLFSTITLPSSALYNFLVPSLQPVDVIKAIIASLDDRHSKTICLPFYTQFTGLLTLMPSFIRDLGQWYSGADYGMEGFVKVTGIRDDEVNKNSTDN